MTNWIAASLFGLYAAVTLIAPTVWARPTLVNTHPRLVLWGWVTSALVAGLSLVAALLLLIQRSLRHEIDPIPNGVWLGPLVDTILGWASIAALGLILFRVGVAVSDLRGARREQGLALAALSSTGDPVQIGNTHALRVSSDLPLVATLSADKKIFFTTALEGQLSDDQLAAAVTHEQAHLHGHHASLRALAAIATAVAPSFRSTKEMARATRIATELAADDAAARRYGPATVAQALAASFPDEGYIPERIRRLDARSNS